MKGNRIICFMLALFCLASMAVSVSAQEPFNVSCIRQFEHNWFYPVYDVAVDGDYAYLACVEDGLRIVNISQPESYNDIARLDIDESTRLAVYGQFVYISKHQGYLDIVDITDKTNPHIVNEMPFFYDIYAIRIFGQRAYICTLSGMKVLDISNPGEPSVLWSSSGFTVYDVEVRSDTAYLACGPGNLRVFDISNINSPMQIGSYGPSYDSGVMDIDLYGNYGILASGDHGFEIIDLTTLQLISHIDSLSFALSLKVRGDYAYLAYGYPECPLAIINISNPQSPQITSIYYPPEDISTFQLVGDEAFIADYYHGIRRVNISDPCNPIEISHYNRIGFDKNVKIVGNMAFDQSEYKLTAIDLSIPAEPRELGHFEANWGYSDFELDGHMAYVVGAEPNVFYSVDFSNPSQPITLQQLALTDQAYYCKVRRYQQYAYLLSWNEMRIIDVSNPAGIIDIGNVPMTTLPTVFHFFSHYAIIETPDYFLQLLDFSNPLSPTLVSSHLINRNCYDLDVIGNLLYVGAYDRLLIFDISDLNNWRLLSETNAQGEEVSLTNNFDIVGSYLYLAVHQNGLYVYDISNPAVPIRTGYYSSPGASCNVAAMGQIAVVADFTNLGIYDCSGAQGVNNEFNPELPSQLALLPNYPNPFNSSTVVRFENTAPGDVAVDIIDLLGRKVAVIASENYQPGLHSIRWDGSDMSGQAVSSGQYFVRVQSGDVSKSLPVTLLK